MSVSPMQDSGLAHADYKATKYFGSLDGLRCICILAVLWHHSPLFGWIENPPQIATRGFTGVDFFFVLSGYLITTLLLREEEKQGRFSITGFYWRRILRILPVYYLVVTFCAIYWVWLKGQDELAPLVPYYYLFFSNMLIDDIPLLAPTWSLSVEEQYYLIWPMLLLLLPTGWRFRLGLLCVLTLVCVLSASGALAPLGLQPIETTYAVWKFPTNSYTAMLLGSMAAVLLHVRACYVVLYRIFGHPAMSLVMLIAVIAALQYSPARLIGWPNLFLHGVMTCFLISVVVRERHALSSVLAWRPIARLGEISYGLYLYHLFGLHIANEIAAALNLSGDMAVWLVSGAFVAISIAISEVSFRTYERFFLNLKHRPVPAPT